MQICAWAEGGSAISERYHNTEWGVPTSDDRKLFEFIVLESAQAGLSWELILKKREGYRKAFHGFDPERVAKMKEDAVLRCVADGGIIRNRAKIEAGIKNAQAFLQMQKEFGSFSKYMWGWVNYVPIVEYRKKGEPLPQTTDLATEMAKDLKKRGFSFLGPIVWYSHMQAVGMVNDHTVDCFRHAEILKLQKKFIREHIDK